MKIVDVEKLAKELTKKLADEGKIIAAGWEGFRLVAMNEDAPQLQIDEMRCAFFAGAQHLLASIIGSMDPGAEETEQDHRRMALIAKELDDFACEFKLKHFSYGQKGNA